MKFLLGCEEILASSFLSALFTPENPHKFLINKGMTVFHELKKSSEESAYQLQKYELLDCAASVQVPERCPVTCRLL